MVQSQGVVSLTIGQLAAGGEVGVETIRFYQRLGLLPTPSRESGIRRYGSEDLRRLRFIRQAQATGFTLEEIRALLQLDAGVAASPANARTAERGPAPSWPPPASDCFIGARLAEPAPRLSS